MATLLFSKTFRSGSTNNKVVVMKPCNSSWNLTPWSFNWDHMPGLKTMKLRFLMSHRWKNSVRDRVIGKKWICLERDMLHRQSVAHLRRWEHILLHSSYTQMWLPLSLKIQSNSQGRTRTDRAQSGTVEEGTKRRSQSTDQRGNLTGQESAKDKVCKAQPPCYFLHVPSLLLKGNTRSQRAPCILH